MPKTVSIDRIVAVLRYDRRTGDLFWAVGGRKRRMDVPAGNVGANGYRYVRVDGVLICAHRIVWAMHHGDWPEHHIDHINRDQSDNRIENLRPATSSENGGNRPAQANNTSGFKGVSLYRPNGKWRASIQKDGKFISLGYFADRRDAAAAYSAAAQELFGEFARVA